MKALVIDSSKRMRAVLRSILSRRGFEVVDAASAQEAREVWKDADVVLVEWNQCGPDVLAFLSSARRSGAFRSVFLVLTDSEPQSRAVTRARMSGTDYILVKPFTSAQLDAVLFGSLAHFSEPQMNIHPHTRVATMFKSEQQPSACAAAW